MSNFRLDRFLELLTSPTMVWGTVAGGFAMLAIALIVLAMTRLGQANPLRKCAILSVLTHVLLAFMLSSVQFAATTTGPYLEDTDIRLLTADDVDDTAVVEPQPIKPWERFVNEPVSEPKPLEPQRPQSPVPPDPKRQAIRDFAQLLGEANVVNLPADDVAVPVPGRIVAGQPTMETASASPAEPIETQAPQRQDRPEVRLAAPASPDRTAGEPQAAPAAEPSRGGVSASLLNQPISVPRMNEPKLTPDPASSLPGPDSPQRGSRPAPREDLPGLVEIQRPRDLASPRDPGGSESGRATNAGVNSLLRRDSTGQSPQESLSGAAPEITPQITTLRRGSVEHEIPGIYKLRVAPDRARLAQQQGGTKETEAAVNAALNWLASNQSADGRWDASQFGAGREDKVLGHDRRGAGANADTGMSGLALLAFLGAGHTHRDGQYQETVARGLDFLIRSQASDGNLAGTAELYAAMYCHGMASIALSEAFALTNDQRLERPLRRAINYTLASQHATAGGWRYRPGDRQGDTSQLGWQLMVLRSAKLAGIPIPKQSEEGMIRFLRSVEAGRHGGLASYRAGERPNRTMTAEAMVCRHFLGLPADEPDAAREAGDFLLEELPGQGRANLYYWYYATMAMHQLQGDYWQTWNRALRKALVESQRIDGRDAGSWDTNTVWGGYGGRVYTTAMGALCLEVYYRFLPLYDPRVAERP
jgi:hypothetical protein